MGDSAGIVSVPPKSIKFAIDRGGTFTDVWASVPGQKDIVLKLLSVDPDNYDDAPSEGIRRVLEIVSGQEISRRSPIPKDLIHSIRMGTTVATNALLERKGRRHAFIVSKGFGDLIEIGHQSRPKLFELGIRKPELLYSEVVEISERITVECFDEDTTNSRPAPKESPGLFVKGITGDILRILQPLDEAEVTTKLKTSKAKGIDTLAVCLVHSYLYPKHEERVAEIAKGLGFNHVSISSEVGANMIKMISRGSSASADAYLTPEIVQYVDGFARGFDGGNLDGVSCEFMQSDGGLVSHKNFNGLRGILSGPADVSRYGGSFELVFETVTAGVSIQSPQLDINTVAAGGGSMLFWKNGMFKVGPESAGAHPGPASYRKGGPLTVTDANLFLGRLVPEYFPAIFGPEENLPLDSEIVAQKFDEITAKINADAGRSMTPEEVAHGFIDVANESMCRPIRALTEARGFETAQHNLATFGGAGGQHACEIAAKLGIRRVVMHKYSSILSAYGMALAEVVQEAREPSSETLGEEALQRLEQKFSLLRQRASDGLLVQGITTSSIVHEEYLNLRYHGTDTNFMILRPADGDWLSALENEHYRELSFTFPRSRRVLVDDVRVRGIGKSGEVTKDSDTLIQELSELDFQDQSKHVNMMKEVYFANGGRQQTKVFRLDDLRPGNMIPGPAIIIDKTQTIIVVPGAQAKVLTSHVVVDLAQEGSRDFSSGELVVDPIKLSIFGHRFMGIAEEMGRTLQKTSISLNIKERLDFSCAIFSPNDITVISPVFDDDAKTICFYTASRGHHLNIGGYRGNSMPPDSVELWQEGASIKSFFLVRDGHFDEEGITAILLEPGNFPGCSGSRNLGDNLSDLKAQVAANNRGSNLIKDLMKEYSRPVVHFYMKKIQENAEAAVREYLKSAYQRFGSNPLTATDYLDNGSMMTVSISIDETGFATLDFTGTSCEMLSNMNAPPAITYSALIYTLRLLIGSDIPLNQGCLAPTKVILPKNTFLNPSSKAAVCCGNTLTSQRLVDLLLKAFQAAAASQGCMNCFGFFGNCLELGAEEDTQNQLDDSGGFAFGYGETICGGEGAGPTWHGASGVQVHMTNTRTTDVEIIEKRYPVLLREFSIRKGSGGKGRFNGGCGVVRDWECRYPLTFGIISERRVHRPFGMHGGEAGESGANYWVQKLEDGSERWVNIGSRGQINMKNGDRCVIHTPGGGGWGVPYDDETASSTDLNEVVKDTDGPPHVTSAYPRAAGSFHNFSAAQEASS
ncbi:hypothetical protein SLS64_010332 [Diaporthe eres]|uniref:5-oxoprolinase n=1 Tax=Diaporthe eres TaxID=83184 RepID=A0ABR1NQ41_DIAER